MFRLMLEGVFKIKRFDAYDAEFDLEFQGNYIRIRYDEWQLAEMSFQDGIPTSFDTFRKKVVEYLENEVKKRIEEERKKEESKKLAEEILNNVLRPCLNVLNAKIEVGPGKIILYISPDS